MSEQRNARIIIGKPGGTSGKNSKTYKISLPSIWINELNISQEDRDVIITFTDDKRIIIEKA